MAEVEGAGAVISWICRPWCAVVGHEWIWTSKDARAFLFCSRCCATSHGWDLVRTVAQGTKASPKATVYDFTTRKRA